MNEGSEFELIELPRLDARSEGFEQHFQELRKRLSPSGDIVSSSGRELTKRVFGEPLSPQQVVERICDDVQNDGTQAVLKYSRELDGADLTADDFPVPVELVEKAHANADPEYLDSIKRIRGNIWEFQSGILHSSVDRPLRPGVRLTQRYVPLKRIGICVPGGAAAYPSTVLMTAVPAQAAGVEEIVIVAPPTKLGAYNPDMLAACHEIGISEIYPVGGAQAVASLAYGTNEIRPVDMIVGPGNLFVALAKRHVYGTVKIDSIAGPSEVVVIADESTDPTHAAADMLAQAEHSPGSSVLITWAPEIVDKIESELNRQLPLLSRAELTIDALKSFGAFVIARDQQQAAELTDQLAPEHLHICIDDARELALKISNAGATFIGPFTPVALGDYAAGPSHVLPTGGTARWASGLSSNDFLRSSSLIEFSRQSLEHIAPDVCCLAEKEGLSAHARSVTIRLPYEY